MRKSYCAPLLDVTRIEPVNLMAVSLPVKEDPTDDEARSKAFWGKCIFDEEVEDDDNGNSWY